MGICNSRKHKKNIKLPENFSLIKLTSINLDLRNSINLKRNIMSIIEYFFNNNFDIAIFQNFMDKIVMLNFITALKKEALNKEIELYFSPEFDILNLSDTVKITVPLTANNFEEKSEFVPHLIVSRLDIENYNLLPLNKKNTSFLISCNIRIKKKIISVYAGSISDDLNGLGVDNKDKRIIELMKIKRRIDINKKSNLKYFGNKATSINLLFGYLPIDEFYNGEINSEYTNAIDICKAIDIHRYMDNSKNIFTSKINKRHEYILFFLPDDLFQTGTELNNQLLKIETSSDMFKLLFKLYSFHPISLKIDQEFDKFNSYPVNLSFMLKNI